ncbi:MAG: hypothetical protein AB8F95_04055 [Bacteroidia bacterium]
MKKIAALLSRVLQPLLIGFFCFALFQGLIVMSKRSENVKIRQFRERGFVTTGYIYREFYNKGGYIEYNYYVDKDKYSGNLSKGKQLLELGVGDSIKLVFNPRNKNKTYPINGHDDTVFFFQFFD